MTIDGKGLKLTGKFLKIARLVDEYCEQVGDVEGFIKQLRASGSKADVFMFVHGLHERNPRFAFPYQERDSMADVAISHVERGKPKPYRNRRCQKE